MYILVSEVFSLTLFYFVFIYIYFKVYYRIILVCFQDTKDS